MKDIRYKASDLTQFTFIKNECDSMKNYKYGCFLCAFFLNVSLVCAEDATNDFTIFLKKADDSATVTKNKNTTLFKIKSPKGISGGKIERKQEKWPENITLFFYLKGLENFKLSNDKISLECSVSSNQNSPLIRIWQEGKEDFPLKPDHPFYINIRLLNNAGNPTKTIPLQEGFFEMQLPKSFFQNNPKTFSLNWIDFYRN